MKPILSPKEFDQFLEEDNIREIGTGVKITLISSKLQDLKLEQELLIEKLETDDNNDCKDMIALAKYFLLIRHMKKVLNGLNKNFLEG